MFGIEELYESILNEVKSPEEIKKILTYQFVDAKGIPQNILDEIFAIDPTNKKNYTRWTLVQWDNYQDEIEKAINSGKLKRLFDYFKERAGNGLDLGQYNFTEALDMLPSDYILWDKDSEDEDANDFDIKYQSKEWMIIVPNTVEADIKLGKGCHWCTAGAYGGDPASFFYDYSAYGPLWINFDLRRGEISADNHKEYPYKRYQFAFQGNNGRSPEFRDSNNQWVDWDDMDMPQGVQDFYSKMGGIYKIAIKGQMNSDLSNFFRDEYERERMDDGIVVKDSSDVEEIALLTKYDNDYEYMPDEEDWLLYDLKEPEVYIDNTPYTEDDIVDNCNGYSVFIMDDEDEHRVYYKNSYQWKSMNLDRYSKMNNIDGYFFVGYGGEYLISLKGEQYGIEIDDDEIPEDIIVRTELSSSDELYLEFIYENQTHCLLEYKRKSKGLEYNRTIVAKDFPKSGDVFPIIKEGNNIIVLGKVRKYYLNSEDVHENFRVIEKIDNTELFIVRWYDKNTYTYVENIYDADEERMLLDKPAIEIEDEGGGIIVEYKDEYYLFDPDKKSICSRPYQNLRSCISYPNIVWIGKRIDDETLDIINMLDNYKIVANCYKCAEKLTNNLLIVKLKQEDEYYSLLDCGDGNILANNIERIFKFNEEVRKYYTGMIINGETLLFSNQQKKCVLNNIMEANPVKVGMKTLWGREDFIWGVKLKNEKWAILGSEGLLTDILFDKVGYMGPLVRTIKDNKVFYFNYKNKQITPKNGIDLSKVTLVDTCGVNIPDDDYLEDHYAIKGQRVTFFYNPIYDRIECDCDSNNESAYQMAYSIVHPEAIRLSENFNQFYNKLLDIY